MDLNMYPNNVVNIADKKVSPQSIMFGHRIKSAQSRMEYLVEFLALAISKKRIKGDAEYQSKIFIVDDRCAEKTIEYIPQSNMGLKRFIFFYNSKADTKASIDEEAAKKCIEIIKECISCGTNELSIKECVSALQTILYDFSIENTGRSWFNKNILPVCPEVLFPEALGRKKLRDEVDLDSDNLDSNFDFNSYTYQCRGGEIYYLHLLQALNDNTGNSDEYRLAIERGIKNMLNSMAQISELCKFIQKKWIDGNESLRVRGDSQPDVKKTTGAIPYDFSLRNREVVEELANFFRCNINPMEQMDILGYGIILQLLRAMFSTATKRIGAKDEAWVLDLCGNNVKEKAEIRKLAGDCYRKNEEVVKKYLNMGIEELCGNYSDEEKYDTYKKAANDSYKLFRKLAKDIGVMIPLKGDEMRFTLSENIIKFLVMSLIPPSNKITFDLFLDLMYEHFSMIVTPEHYTMALRDGKVSANENVSFLHANKDEFCQKLKDCGFLRDLSDATAIVENVYEGCE